MAGRPKYSPNDADRNTVKVMAACGFPQETIAKCLGEDGIDAKTLRKHFKRELDTAADRANASVARKLYEKAVAGEPWAVCFWLKTRAGWREINRMEHTGPDGSPIAVALVERLTAGRQRAAREGKQDAAH